MSIEYKHLFGLVIKHRLLSVGSYLVAGLLATATVSSFEEDNKIVTGSLLGGSLFSAGSGMLLDDSRRKYAELLNQYKEASREGLIKAWSRPQRIASLSQKEHGGAINSQSVLSSPPIDVNKLLQDRNSFPNVFIVGIPGTGKSTLAEILATQLSPDSLKVVIHPHLKPGEFTSCQLKLAGGRNIGNSSDSVKEIPVEQLDDNDSAAQGIYSLHLTMRQRYEEYYKGKKQFVPLDCFIDELPAISQQLGVKWLKQYVPSLLMESRKVGIRIWLLSQSLTVESMGLSGLSDLRDNSTVIRLGKFAVRHMEQLVKAGKADNQQLVNLKQQSRQATLDYSVFIVPDVGASLNSSQTGFLQGANKARSLEEGLRSSQIETVHVIAEKILSKLAVKHPNEVSCLNTQLLKVGLTAREFISLVNDRKLSPSQIIREQFGVTGGKTYQAVNLVIQKLRDN